MIRKQFRLIISAGLITSALIIAGIAIPYTVRSLPPATPQITTRGGATVEMMDYALNLKRAYNVQIFGKDAGRTISGTQFGPNTIDPAIGADIEDSVRAIGQLPCENVVSTSLGGRSFEAGVYCLESAELSGSMTLDGGGDPNARFVFRVKGSIDTAPDSRIEVINGARSAFVTLVAGESMTLGDRSQITANLMSADDLTILGGSTVWGRAISVKGNVLVTDSNVGAATGYLEVCKSITPGDQIVPGTLFTFNVAGTDYTAPAGACSAPIVVAAGPVTVTEAPRDNTAVVSIETTPADRRVSHSLGLRQAVVSVPEGDASNQTIVTFTNQTTATGMLEICKYGLDNDVRNFFQYTVQGVAGQTFAVPVGFCSGLITTTIAQDPQTSFRANVTELAQDTFRLEAVDTLPTGRLAGPFVPDQGFDADGAPLASNINGGYASVLLVAGGANVQTLVNFYNRSLPGRIKVCKFVADSRIPTATAFDFDVSGFAPTSPTQTLPAISTATSVSVLPNSCSIVPGTFIVGTTVTITEAGMTPATFTSGGITYDFNDIRVSRIIADPGLLTVDLPARTTTLTVRNALVEVDYTNFIFRPTLLKLCKAGGPGVTGSALFTLSLVDPLTSWPVSTAPIRIPVGSCTIVNGPFPGLASFPIPNGGGALFGTFNLGTQVTITETISAATVLSTVTSPTGNPVVRNGQAGTITLNQIPNSLNEIRFLNALLIIDTTAVRFDFDGDGASDKIIFRNGMWWYAASGSNFAENAIQFGLAGDKLVAADYDGDGKTDTAVYRNGTWFVLGSTAGLMQLQFGLATDIPQPGDYDGDGKADFAVFRPSDGVWYMQRTTAGFGAVQFGVSTDKPVAADFDGDGRMDQAVYRSGTWFVLGSTAGFYGAQFGVATDIPVQADFDGDNKADMAVYRAGTWHVLGTSAGYYAAQFGVATDIPVPADYDGDGKTDLAVYRTSTTEWHIIRSSQTLNPGGGYVSYQFGAPGDALTTY